MKSISLILLLSSILKVEGNHCESRQESYFSKKTGKRLVVSENDILFTRAVQQPEHCLGICRENRSCQSINIEHGSKTCYFLGVDRLTLPLNFTSDEGYSYFEIYLQNDCQSVKYNRNPLPFARDCLDVYDAGYKESGVYNINIANKQINVLCFTSPDVEEGGGWTVIQLRNNLYDVSFSQNWNEYKKGFGDLRKEFWLGNENIHQLTRDRTHQLIVDFTFDGANYSVFHDQFRVENEENSYQLFVKQLDVFTDWRREFFKEHDRKKFTTPDRDNDVRANRHCGQWAMAGWWYTTCGMVQLNNAHIEYGGLRWYPLTKNGPMMSFVRMRIKFVQ